jgi:hypothetical protein
MVKYEYELVEKFNSINEFKQYRNENLPFASQRGKTENCNMCHGMIHKMKTSYYICSNKPCLEIDICPVQYKTTTCLKNKDPERQKLKLLKLKGKDHNSTEKENKVRGLTEKVKQAIEDIINDYDAKPKRIFIRLTTKDKYKDIIDIKPTLLQIQNYINYRRQTQQISQTQQKRGRGRPRLAEKALVVETNTNIYRKTTRQSQRNNKN